MYLMVEMEARIEEVAFAVHEHIRNAKFFPRIAELREILEPVVQQRMARDRTAERVAQLQAAADENIPALEPGEIDYQRVDSADLPDGYDYTSDKHWQRGMAMMAARSEGKDFGIFNDMLDRMNRPRERRYSQRPVPACSHCRGARYVRLGGADPVGMTPGAAESRAVRCPVCYSDRIILNGAKT